MGKALTHHNLGGICSSDGMSGLVAVPAERTSGPGLHNIIGNNLLEQSVLVGASQLMS